MLRQLSTLGALVCTTTALAHVDLIAPNGGEEFAVGSVATIAWEVVIPHDTQNWDVFYSTTGAGGPWIPIALDIPHDGDAYTLEWTVPDDPSDDVRVRVVQDNEGMDYQDISEASLAIVARGCPEDTDDDGLVGIEDLLQVLADWGACSACAGDVNGDRVVDVEDLLAIIGVWGPC